MCILLHSSNTRENNQILFTVVCSDILLRAHFKTVIHCPGMTLTAFIPSEIISNRVCGIWHFNGEGADVLIKQISI